MGSCKKRAGMRRALSRRAMSTVSFALDSAPSPPRLGALLVARDDDGTRLELPTPNFLASTSRGAVPHLSRDHVLLTDAVRGVHITYDSFLEQSPPLPPLYPSARPLHDFLAFPPARHVLSLSVAQSDSAPRVAPPNGNAFVNVWTGRGIRRAVPAQFHADALKCNVDLLEAITDAPGTQPPFSQRRVTKSVERGVAWLQDLLARGAVQGVLVHMAGCAELAARTAFAGALLEVEGGARMVDGVLGVVFDLAHLRWVLNAERTVDETTTAIGTDPRRHPLAPYLHASLSPLPAAKLRVARGTTSPHDVLLLIRDVGVDLFDARWAQDAAGLGVALDFAFPAPPGDGLLDVGHNLYDARYAHDYAPLTASRCPCIACSPAPPAAPISHTVSSPADAHAAPQTSATRSYVHHLLRTHEMTAHALLAAHNLSILAAFFASIRSVRADEFGAEVARFVARYDGRLRILDEARRDWRDVDLARGKGRLAREKVRAAEAEG